MSVGELQHQGCDAPTEAREDQQPQAAEAIEIKCSDDVDDLRAVCLVLAIVGDVVRVVGDGDVDGVDGCLGGGLWMKEEWWSWAGDKYL